MKLKGGLAQCPTCSRYFSSTKTFDEHRGGPPNKRICLNPRLKGLELKEGVWHRPDVKETK